MLTVVCYDIADDFRRGRVARVLEGWGVRVQDSVFECHISVAERNQIIHEIARVIDTDQDKVRYYSLCGKDRRKLTIMGRGEKTKEIAYWLG